MSPTHVRKALVIDPADIEIRYSPETLRAFRRLEAIVHGSEHFDGDLLINLQLVADGKPHLMASALTDLVMFATETAAYVRATGDKTAEEALSGIEDCLMGENTKGIGYALARREPRKAR